MKWFPKIKPPEFTPAVVEGCRRASRVGYCFALAWAGGALGLLAFGRIELNVWAWFGPVVFLWFAEAASRSACLHERVIELTKKIDELDPDDARNEGGQSGEAGT